MKKIGIIIIQLLWISQLAFGQNQTNFKILRSLKIPSSGGWDYISVDEINQKIYVSHGNQVNILDVATGDSVGYIPNTNGVHGIAFVPEKNEGYISAGRLNSIITFDLKTYQVKDSIKVGKNPDAIFYDESAKHIITCNGGSKDMSFVDINTDKLVSTLALGGKPETAVSNGNGMVYVNLEDKSEVLKLDGNKFSILAHYKLNGGEEPTGLSIDNKTHRLMVSCGGNKLLIILDAIHGKEIARIETGEGTDGNAFDPEKHLVFSSNGEGTLTIVKELSANKFVKVQNLKTEKGARTIGINLKNHRVYLPTADFMPKEVGQRWPKMVPGSFRILEIGE